MIINSADLNVTLSSRPFVISCPAVGVELHCDLNETRDRIIGTWIIGNDSPETLRIADLMIAAGNARLQAMKLVHGDLRSGDCKRLELVNDTRVFDGLSDQDDWLGTGTRDAIKAAGGRVDPASWGYYPKELLVDGWAFRAPARG
jgi:hypothetical protein